MISQKAEIRIVVQSDNTASGYLSKGNKNIALRIYMHLGI